MIVALDTVVLAHYSDHANMPPHPVVDPIRQECSRLLEAIALREGLVDVVIAAPVLSEFTASTATPEARRALATEFQSARIVYPLDFTTSVLAGELAGQLRSNGQWPPGGRYDDEFIKVDCMIMALATQRRCDYMCTENYRELQGMQVAMHQLGHQAPEVVRAAEMRRLIEAAHPI